MARKNKSMAYTALIRGSEEHGTRCKNVEIRAVADGGSLFVYIDGHYAMMIGYANIYYHQSILDRHGFTLFPAEMVWKEINP